MARKRNRKKERTPQPNIVEYASSTARLITSMVKMAGDNNCIDDAFTAFRDQIEDVLDEYQRDLIKTLFYECYENLKAIRGSEKSTSKSSTKTNTLTRNAPEPVPKKTEVGLKAILATNKEVKFGCPYKSLFGYGVKEKDAPGKYLIDKLLVIGDYSKEDIVQITGLNKDTVRKRITFIMKYIPEVSIINPYSDSINKKKPVLKAQLNQ